MTQAVTQASDWQFELNADEQAENQLAKHAIHVHKFGGSSLATPECIIRVVEIIQQNCQLNDIVVVSANGKTTDKLFALYTLANKLSTDQDKQEQTEKQAQEVSQALNDLHAMQIELVTRLLKPSYAKQLLKALEYDFEQLNLWLEDELTRHHNDILSFGEIWSARLLSALLNEKVCPSNSIDSRDFLVIDNEQNCNVDQSLSATNLKKRRQFGKLAVITGYICQDAKGRTCTLGRNGSDYSATIMASLLGALNVTLWTDVDGIYSADPRVVPNARKLHRLPNGVAKELGRLGNPVLHAKTLTPLVNESLDHHCHLHVASSFDAQVTGTEIGKFGQIAKQELSVTYLNDLILAQSDSFTGEFLAKILQAFTPICADEKQKQLVIRQDQQKALSQYVAGQHTQVKFQTVAIIAAVGHKVAQRGDIKARFKRSLKSAQPLCILASDNSHSIIAILPEPCSSELLNNVHHDMTKDARHIGVVVAGLGNIGQRFLELLPAQLNRVYALENIHLVGLLSSKKALINNDGIDVNQSITLFNSDAQPYDHQQLLSWLSNHPYDELIVVDITPSEDFSLLYQDFLAQGIHVIGANKWAASSSTEHYNQLVNTADKNDSLWLGNTTVGAGLPINYAINDLNNSGDKITAIAGIFSGTLSWLFETYDGSSPFSALLIDALEQGITEPDPREDLSGRDVQRKLLILARMAGFELSLDDIDCKNLVPTSLQNISVKEFLARANELDDFFANALNEAESKDCCIRYVARFMVTEDDKIKAKVSLEMLPQTDAFASLTPCDNIFQISSHWYQDNPLIIRGPGAGRDVTAGGIHSDLVNICQQLAHKQSQVKIKGIT
ncbi:MAG: bifunctional aspartate kinase/homoserine dehydrogenase II [Colwellia sp.]|nr:bifunctional aspartate kinase/homoserine dehydrogenase II [Colwellia sp.]MCW9081933.1 bifunctional aspartate kinase/homoserine dehydrogenase II [Colwellia sp.]